MSNFINFIDPLTQVKQQALKKWMQTTRTIIVSICCCTALALCYYLIPIIVLVYRSHLNQDQTHRIQELSGSLDTLQATITTRHNALSTARSLLEQPSGSVSSLAYLANVMPNNIALQECCITTKNWLIKGSAKSSPCLQTFIRALKKQEYFKTATLTSLQITRDNHNETIFAFTCEGFSDKQPKI
jgi:Tfp pilus assembly protein PilN